MTGYVLSVDAGLDIDEIWEYIAADNIGAVDRWSGARHKDGQLWDTQGAPVAPAILSPVFFPVRTTPPAAKTAGATPEK